MLRPAATRPAPIAMLPVALTAVRTRLCFALAVVALAHRLRRAR